MSSYLWLSLSITAVVTIVGILIITHDAGVEASHYLKGWSCEMLEEKISIEKGKIVKNAFYDQLIEAYNDRCKV